MYQPFSRPAGGQPPGQSQLSNRPGLGVGRADVRAAASHFENAVHVVAVRKTFHSPCVGVGGLFFFLVVGRAGHLSVATSERPAPRRFAPPGAERPAATRSAAFSSRSGRLGGARPEATRSAAFFRAVMPTGDRRGGMAAQQLRPAPAAGIPCPNSFRRLTSQQRGGAGVSEEGRQEGR